MFACLVRQVPFLRQREMQKLPAREWMNNMAERAKLGIEKERGWDKIQGILDKEGQHFLKMLMDSDLDKRYTAMNALRDKWLLRHSPEEVFVPAATPMPQAAQWKRTAPPPAALTIKDGSDDDEPEPSSQQGHSPKRRVAEDHMHAGSEGLAAQQQGELLALVPGMGRGGLGADVAD